MKKAPKSPSQIFAALRKAAYKERPKEINVVLLKDKPGIGNAGDVVQVKPAEMRRDWYPNKEAVYAIKENILRYSVKPFIAKEMIQKQGISEEEAWQKVDEEIEKRKAARLESISQIRYPRWFEEQMKQKDAA
jgi:hypothetical protein